MSQSLTLLGAGYSMLPEEQPGAFQRSPPGFLWTAKGEQGERNREFHALFLVLLVEENQ